MTALDRVDCIIGLLGLALLAGGLALWSVPLAMVVIGGLLFGLAVWPLLVTPRRER